MLLAMTSIKIHYYNIHLHVYNCEMKPSPYMVIHAME